MRRLSKVGFPLIDLGMAEFKNNPYKVGIAEEVDPSFWGDTAMAEFKYDPWKAGEEIMMGYTRTDPFKMGYTRTDPFKMGYTRIDPFKVGYASDTWNPGGGYYDGRGTYRPGGGFVKHSDVLWHHVRKDRPRAHTFAEAGPFGRGHFARLRGDYSYAAGTAVLGALDAILGAAKAGDPKAKAAIKKVVRKAKAGSPKAKRAVSDLKKVDKAQKARAKVRRKLVSKPTTSLASMFSSGLRALWRTHG